MSPETRLASASVNVAKPAQSGRRARGSRDSDTLAAVSAIAATPTGALTKKIHRQDSPDVRMPPNNGPMATASPVIAPQTPKAMPRSSLLCGAAQTTLMLQLSRAVQGIGVVWAAPQSNEATVNTPTPIK